MTGYAQGGGEGWIGEIHSVNRRHLEVRIAGQPEQEATIRSQVRAAARRGQVTVTIRLEGEPPLEANYPLLERLWQAAQGAGERLGMDARECFALMAKGQGGNLLVAGKVDVEIDLDELLDKWNEQRLNEGEAIATDLLPRIGKMRELAMVAEERAEGTVERYREKIRERLKEVEDERVFKEVAIFAERADTTEEVIRFRHHLSELAKAIEGPELASGKALEFRLQELLREVNTIGSKALDLEVSDAVVAIKSELERIREQVQNVE